LAQSSFEFLYLFTQIVIVLNSIMVALPSTILVTSLLGSRLCR
jgi:hypothetical protein